MIQERNRRWVRFGLSLAIGLALLAAIVVALNPVFWDRYLHAYTFDSFVTHPFPAIDRLYPQERVPGAAVPRLLPVAGPGQRTISDGALAAAAEFAERSDSTSLIVYHDGRIELERYWLGAGPERPVYSFSMHKSVVALLIGIAIADGVIGGVDEPLARYIPELGADGRRAITIANALHMASGFEPMDFPKNPFSKHVRRQIGTDLRAAALDYRLRDQPGTTFDYNGVNPTLLLMVLERATGRRYAEYLSEKLWRPLGNRDAAVWLDREGGLARGATSLYAVPMDWLRIGVLMLERGRVEGTQVVPEDWLAQMAIPSPGNPLYGYLLWIGTQHVPERTLASFRGFAAQAREPFKAPDVVYFDGLGGQRVYVVPSRRLVIVRTGVLARDWEDVVLPNLLIDGITEQADD